MKTLFISLFLMLSTLFGFSQTQYSFTILLNGTTTANPTYSAPCKITITNSYGSTVTISGVKDTNIFNGVSITLNITISDTNKYIYIESALGIPIDTILITSTVSINELVSKIKFNLYPNPTTDFLNISGDFKDGEIFEIYDITGKKLQVGEIQDSRAIINVSDLPKGVYLIKIRDSVQRFIKN